MKYVSIFKKYLATSLEYRSSLVGLILMEVVGIASISLLWISVYKNNGQIGGFEFKDIILYYLLVPAIGIVTESSTALMLGDEIKAGILSIRMVKPVSLWLTYFSQAIATKFSTVTIIVPFYLFIILVASIILHITPVGPLPLLLGFLVAICAFVFSFVLDLAVGSLAFFMDEIWWFRHLKSFTFGILAGVTFPLSFMPEGIRSIVLLLPFKFLYYTPIQYALGDRTIANLVPDLTLLGFWIVIIAIVAAAIWERGVKKYESFGN